MPLEGVERIFDQVLHDPFEQGGVDLGLDRSDGQAVVVDGDVAGCPGPEVHDRSAYHFVDVLRGERGFRSDFREAVHDLHQVAQVLVHLFDGTLIDGLRAQVFDPSQQRGGGGTQLVRRFFGQSDPYAVLLVLLGRAESDETQQDEDRNDGELDVGEPVEGLEQPGLAEEYDVFVVFAPVVLDRDRGILFGELVDLLAQAVGMVDDLFGNEMRVQYLQVLIGDDEGDVVALTQDVLDEGVVARVAHHALHGVYPEGHFVLFLLPQAAGHVVGEQQGQRHHRHSDDDGYDPLAEREYFAPQFEHKPVISFRTSARS